MKGSKSIRYWDKETRTIKVSKNFTFRKNRELKELKVTEIPSLGAEGESTTLQHLKPHWKMLNLLQKHKNIIFQKLHHEYYNLKTLKLTKQCDHIRRRVLRMNK